MTVTTCDLCGRTITYKDAQHNEVTYQAHKVDLAATMHYPFDMCTGCYSVHLRTMNDLGAMYVQMRSENVVIERVTVMPSQTRPLT